MCITLMMFRQAKEADKFQYQTSLSQLKVRFFHELLLQLYNRTCCLLTLAGVMAIESYIKTWCIGNKPNTENSRDHFYDDIDRKHWLSLQTYLVGHMTSF